jgi:hypothetical protein
MENLCWGAPILPGKLEQWHRFNDEMQGPRREEHAASRREMGMHREVVSLMETPDGQFVSLYHGADDLAKAFPALRRRTPRTWGGSERRSQRFTGCRPRCCWVLRRHGSSWTGEAEQDPPRFCSGSVQAILTGRAA